MNKTNISKAKKTGICTGAVVGALAVIGGAVFLVKKIRSKAFNDGYEVGKLAGSGENDLLTMKNEILQKQKKELEKDYTDLKLLYEDALDDLDELYEYSF